MVLDLRTGAAAHQGPGVLVTRADASLRRPATLPPGWRVAVLAIGPLDRPAVHRLLGRTPDAWLPRTERLARAATSGRLPATLPGTWLRATRPLLKGWLR